MPTTRQPLSVRTRFEVFKRDEFQCRYCGRRSPEVVLEIDHVVPVCDDGSDDPINLVTACWECNSGKAGVPLRETMTGEDPHDRALLLLENERQLREYDVVLRGERERRELSAQELLNWWCEQTVTRDIPRRHFIWLIGELKRTPVEFIRSAMYVALNNGKTSDWRYLMAVVRNHRDELA